MLKNIFKFDRSYRFYDPSYIVKPEELKTMVELTRYSPCARNGQILKYKFIVGEDAKRLKGLYKMGSLLDDEDRPTDNQRPSAFIVVMLDNEKGELDQYAVMDAAIASHSILLKASEMRLGGIMLGSADLEKIVEIFEIDKRYTPLLLIAIGKPNEKIEIVDIDDSDDRSYYKKNAVHYVPKVKLDDLIV